jgi:tripartite-type tricarboxylate transporter receptor subunit TctC
MRIMKLQLFKILGRLLMLSILLALSTAAAIAASYPEKPLRYVIPFAAGGGSDIVGRMIAAKLTESLGKQVIVENRGGAGTVIGTEIVAKADADGYTLLQGSNAFTTNPALQKLPYDPVKSFSPVARLGNGPTSLVVHPSVPVNSVKELITLAKQRPGQLVFGCSGVGAIIHMSTELFKMMADIDFKIVQFKGGGPVMIDLLGGHHHAQFGSLIQSLPHIQTGKFRVLGTTGMKRSVILPDVPTVGESLPGYESTIWWGMLAPAGTPAPIVERLNKELKTILALDEVKKQFLDNGAEVDYLGTTEFGQFIERESVKWARVIKMANIKLEQ